MSEPVFCIGCGVQLHKDEVALTRKMVNRGAVGFFCLCCLSEHFDVPVTVLREKIREFRNMGCTLFN